MFYYGFVEDEIPDRLQDLLPRTIEVPMPTTKNCDEFHELKRELLNVELEERPLDHSHVPLFGANEIEVSRLALVQG